MNSAIDKLPPFERLRCQNPQVRTVGEKNVAYFQHMDYDERTPPTEGEADLMCKTSGRPCPVAKECLQLGLALEAVSGVWGGRVLVDGKDYYQHEQGGVNGSNNSQ